MKTLTLTLSLLLTATVAFTQEWNLPWIHYPQADSTSQIWFKKIFSLKQRPLTANLYMSTQGKAIVYVNGYNVTTDVLEPTDTSGITRYDASRYLAEGTNTVAVWYSPVPPCNHSDRQFALTLCVTLSNKERFALSTDDTWLCQTANATTTATGDEIINANEYVEGWNTADCGIMGWLHATTTHYATPSMDVGLWHTAMRFGEIQGYNFLDDLGQTVTYHFAKPFYGWVRLTLRDMQQGDTISVNGLTYVCTGEDDEQACRRFTTAPSRTATVTGPTNFSRDNITNIEAISIESYLHRSYQY